MYQVIARKYRPQTFQDVVNQDHVKQTLSNALTQGRVGHGYIFSGPRGTGKTTMARIVAKALNCEKGPSPEPCLQCVSCTEITGGNSMDLIEIDAASNRRIDDIRELRENVRYRPVRDRYKVFIIDEAHQITADAFNALLKTLEEPPEWVVFILCTTEPHEFPATIVSRCQNFPFRTVEADQVVERLRWICEQEGVAADEEALVAIALAGDGSIRDSLSTLDQAIASFGNKLQAAPVKDLLGVIPAEITAAVTSALRHSQPQQMLEVVEQLCCEGRHLQHFSGELARYFRNLLVMKVSGADTRLVTAGDEERKRISGYLEYFSQEDLTRYLQLSIDLYRDLQQAIQPRFRLEVGLLKLVHAGRLTPIEKVLAEWGDSGAGNKSAGPVPAGRGEESNPEAASPAAPEAPSGPLRPAAADAAPSAPAERLPELSAGGSAAPPPAGEAMSMEAGPGLQQKVVAAFRASGDDFTADAIERALISQAGAQIEIRPSADDMAALQINFGAVTQTIQRLGGQKLHAKLGDQLGSGAAEQAAGQAAGEAHSGSNGALESPSESGRQPEPEERTDTERRALADPEVQEFQQQFGGRIREVRDLRGYSQ